MKTCFYCAEEIQDAAIVCKHCGRELATGRTGRENPPNPVIAALLSFLVPGAGQMYIGRIGVGLLYLVFTIAFYALWIVFGVLLHLICIIHASATASAKKAEILRPPAHP